jgi:hypothetical protein
MTAGRVGATAIHPLVACAPDLGLSDLRTQQALHDALRPFG